MTVESSIYADFMVCQGSKRSRRLKEGYGEENAQGIFRRKVAELMNDVPLKVQKKHDPLRVYCIFHLYIYV